MAKLFAEKVTPDSAFIVANEGSSRCFADNTNVVTSDGIKPIKSIKIGDNVLSYNGESNEFKKVQDVIVTKSNKPCFRIKLKNGHIIECTQDHKFFFEGRYIEIKNIVSLWNEKEKKDNGKKP